MKSLSDYQNAYKHLAFERRNGILLVRFHSNGGQLIWSRALNHELADAFYDISADPENLVVILTGTGDAFCESMDLSEFTENVGVTDVIQNLRDISHEVLRALDIEVPVIGVFNGPARVHADVLLLSDIVLAADSTVIEDGVHFKTGHVPPADGSHVLWPLLLGPNRGRAYLLTGQEIGAEEAKQLGLVAEVLPKDRVLDRAWELAEEFTKRPPHVLRLTRRALTLQLKHAFRDSHDEGATLEMLAALAGMYNKASGSAH